MERNGKHRQEGELKEDLLQAGLEVLKDYPYQSLTLRKVADKAKVSHNSPYKVFNTENDLFKAMSERIEEEMLKAESLFSYFRKHPERLDFACKSGLLSLESKAAKQYLEHGGTKEGFLAEAGYILNGDLAKNLPYPDKE